MKLRIPTWLRYLRVSLHREKPARSPDKPKRKRFKIRIGFKFKF